MALHLIRIRGNTLAYYARWYMTNALDNLSDGSPRQEQDTCPAGSTTPQVHALTDDQWACLDALANPAGGVLLTAEQDVTECFQDLLRALQPIEYEYDDDLRPISIDELLQHSRLIGADGEVLLERGATTEQYKGKIGGNGPQFYLDIDDDYARGEVRGNASVVYGRVIWSPGQPGLLKLEYAHIRAGSWMPGRYMYDSFFEHEGDGESAFVMVRVAQRAEGPRAWMVGTITTGHEHDRSCPSPEGMNSTEPTSRVPVLAEVVDGVQRPVIFIGHGSHSNAPLPGKFAAGFGSTDWFPPQEPRYRTMPTLIASNADVRATVFTERVKWGKDPGSYKGKSAIAPPGEGCHCGGAASGGAR